MLNLPVQKNYLIAPISLLCVMFGIYFANLNELLEFNRDLIIQGEYWRVLSGHLTHSNGYHLLLNSAGVFLIWALHGEYYSTKQYGLMCALLCLYCGVALFMFYPENIIYTGMSGVLHGVIIIGALIDCSKKMKTGYLLFVGVWLKIAWEFYQGADPALAELIDARVAIEAHLIGAISGIFVYAKLFSAHLKQSSQ